MSGTSLPAGPDLAGAMPNDPGRRPSGLVAAFVVALALHSLALIGIAFLRLAPPAPPGEQQISIDLAPLMTEAETQAPSEQQASVATPPETTPTEQPVEEATQPPPPAEVAEVKPEETPAETPPQTQAMVEAPPETVPLEPESQIVTSTAPEAEPMAPPPPVVAETPKPVEPEKPKPDLAKLKAEREAKLKAAREAKRREELAEERREAIREAKIKAAREAKAREAKASQGASTQNSASASRQNAAGRAAAGSDPSAMRQWTGAISAAIHGRMNPGAAVGTAGGTALIRFTVSRSGQVSGAGLARSSGVGQIDSAALGAVRGSLPAAPPGVNQASLTVTIPLNYKVR